MGWAELDEQAFMKRHEQAQSFGAGASYFTPEAGPAGKPNRYRLRLLPPHENMIDPESGLPYPIVEAVMHFGLGPGTDRKKKVAINCLAWYGVDCPACQYLDSLRESGKNEDDPETKIKVEKSIGDMAAKRRYFASVVDIAHPERSILRYAFGPMVWKELDNAFLGDDGKWRNITHPTTGRDVILLAEIKMTRDGPFPQYSAKAAETSTPLLDMDWLDHLPDLSELLKEPSREAVLNALKGIRPGTAAAPRPIAAAPAPPVAPALAAPPAAAPKAALAPTAPKATSVPAAAVPAPAPTAPKPPSTAKTRTKRQPVTEEAAEQPASDDPWAVGRAAILATGFTQATEITPEQVEQARKPNCFTVEPEPTDKMCQSCRVLLACMTYKLQGEQAA